MKRFVSTLIIVLVFGMLAGLYAQTVGVGVFSRIYLGGTGTPHVELRWGSGDPSGSVTAVAGSLYQRTNGSIYSSSGGTSWTQLATGGSSAPTDAEYWVGASNGTLTAEKNLGALGTGGVINTGGVPSIMGSNTCTNQFPRSATASNSWTCASVANADLAGSIAASKLVGTDIATVGTIISGTWTGTTIAFANGGTGLTSASDDQTIISSGSAWVAKTLPDCTDTGGNHLNYTQSTNAFSCGTSGGGGGGSSLDTITAAVAQDITRSSGNNYGQIFNWTLTTNTKYAFVIGEGAASSNGTAGGQGLFQINTLSTSTAVGLDIENYGATFGLKVADAASDMTFFNIDQDGEVCIQCSSAATHALQITDTAATGTYIDGGTAVFSNTVRITAGEIGVLSGDFLVTMNTGTEAARWLTTTRQLALNGAATTTLGVSMLTIGQGGNIWNVGNYALIAFGYGANGSATPPAFLGFNTISGAGNTNGDLIFGTRADTSSTPTVRLRIDTQGTLIIPSTTPTPAVTNTTANSCGTTAATIVGNNNIGTITVGATAGTSCTVTFTTTAPVEWICQINDASTNVVSSATPTSTTVSIFKGAFTAGDLINYTCFAR